MVVNNVSDNAGSQPFYLKFRHCIYFAQGNAVINLNYRFVESHPSFVATTANSSFYEPHVNYQFSISIDSKP
jgi:hypothetical protein